MRAGLSLAVAVSALGCASSIFLSPIPNIQSYEPLSEPGKATVYGQILNQSRDVHLVIGRKDSQFKGNHILADFNGLFAIKLDSGSYELYVDKVGETRPGNFLESPPHQGFDPSGPPDGSTKDSYDINYEIRITGGKLIYVGSYFLMSRNIEINFEKGETDKLMENKYPGFARGNSVEQYPFRPQAH